MLINTTWLRCGSHIELHMLHQTTKPSASLNGQNTLNTHSRAHHFCLQSVPLLLYHLTNTIFIVS